MGQYLVPIFEFYPKHCVRESLKDSSLKLDNVFFGQRLSSKQIEHFAAIVDITKELGFIARRILGTRNPNKPIGLAFAPACQACGLDAAQFVASDAPYMCCNNRQVFAHMRCRLVGMDEARFAECQLISLRLLSASLYPFCNLGQALRQDFMKASPSPTA